MRCTKRQLYVLNSRILIDNPDTKLVWARFVDGVLFKYTWTATAVAESEYGAVNGEVGKPLIFEFVVVGLAGYVLRRIGQGREGEGLVDGLDTEFLPLFGT